MTPVETLTETTSQAYQTLKSRIHQDLLNRLNLDRLTRMTRAEAEPEVRAVIRDMLDRESQRPPRSRGSRHARVPFGADVGVPARGRHGADERHRVRRYRRRQDDAVEHP